MATFALFDRYISEGALKEMERARKKLRAALEGGDEKPEPWERDVSAALERRLSGLAGTPGLTQKILETGGKRKMKKKMILSVVLAALLILSNGAFSNG